MSNQEDCFSYTVYSIEDHADPASDASPVSEKIRPGGSFHPFQRPGQVFVCFP